MIFSIISIFPEMFAALSQNGIVGRAFAGDLFKLNFHNPRDFTTDNYRRIDDKTFGGGAGMVMKIEPLEKSLHEAHKIQKEQGVKNSLVIYMSPQGKKVDQKVINQLSTYDGIIIVSGRYEGVDERFIERNVDIELSVGDFVVSGGEIPAMLVIDGIVRQIPGSMNSMESVEHDSFMNGLLDCPHYAAPRNYEGSIVPDELLSGDHEKIRKWRLQQSLWRTYQRRPDLLADKQLTKEQSRLLEEMISRNKI
ncbi:MAG: tRNA (guanosine(37)-N1)-methyltransferase TrmD [Burkholderiales bacterium]|nr:tRNA (guanosine(37)-N1)-methyltransferase TrmD [Burkholderiales bacterium]